MIMPICRDILLLSQVSAPADASDLPTVQNLRDTLRANADRCVGMAANMIGVRKRIIIVAGAVPIIMLNPEIIAKSGAYTAEEGCLSLDGVRTAQRYRSITVRWQTPDMEQKQMRFGGYIAQIIQHEIDHLNGILI